MIDIRTIQQLSNEFLKGSSGFVVDIKIASGNVIRVSLDNDKHTSVQECIALSRHIEGAFDREEEDFSLDVGSPGLDLPLKVDRQYMKRIGTPVMVQPKNGKKVEGELLRVNTNESGEVISLVIKTREKQRQEGRKAKHWVEEEHEFALNDLEWTKVIISFK